MPFYEYECDACHATMTLEQPIANHKAPEVCPKCGTKGKVRRVFTAAAVQFKGSGWYCTDHHSPSGNVATGKKGK